MEKANCRYCRGSGKILLLDGYVACECAGPSNEAIAGAGADLLREIPVLVFKNTPGTGVLTYCPCRENERVCYRIIWPEVKVEVYGTVASDPHVGADGAWYITVRPPRTQEESAQVRDAVAASLTRMGLDRVDELDYEFLE